VGALVGAVVGALVGALEGALVGALEGALVGGLVGGLVGKLVGGLVGLEGRFGSVQLPLMHTWVICAGKPMLIVIPFDWAWMEGAHIATQMRARTRRPDKINKKKVKERVCGIDVPLILDLGKRKRDAKRAPNKIVSELVMRPAPEVEVGEPVVL
jgi:hypothetical protein